MTFLGYSLSGLVAVAIIFLGARFILAATAAAKAFGIANSPSPSTGFDAWLAVKGTRDIVSGLLVFLVMANGSLYLLGQFMVVASLIPLGDAAIVLRLGGSRNAAFGIHGAAALIMLAAGAILIIASS